MVSAFGSSLGRPCRIPCNHHRSGLERGCRRNCLPYTAFLVARRSSGGLSAISDGRRGCCEEEDGQLQRREKDQAEFIAGVQPWSTFWWNSLLSSLSTTSMRKRSVVLVLRRRSTMRKWSIELGMLAITLVLCWRQSSCRSCNRLPYSKAEAVDPPTSLNITQIPTRDRIE